MPKGKRSKETLMDEGAVIRGQKETGSDTDFVPEKEVSPEDILTKAIDRTGAMRNRKTDDELDNELNNIDTPSFSQQDNSGNSMKDFNGNTNFVDTDLLTTGFGGFSKPEVPAIRKVAIKKISPYNFRMGLERTTERFNLVPGAKHTFQVDKKGNQFVTGLEDFPEVRKRLEKKLNVDLGPDSKFWSMYTIDLHDKEHGEILNFDDPVFGVQNELKYYALKGSPLVANGKHEKENGTKPFAEWYIEDKDAEAAAKEKDMQFEEEAYGLFKDLPRTRHQDIGKLAGLPVFGLSPNAASVEVWEWLKKKPQHARDFLKFAKMQDTEFAVRVLVKNAIKFNVIRRDKSLNLVFANEVLGADENIVVSKLAQGPNSSLRASIANQVNAKMI